MSYFSSGGGGGGGEGGGSVVHGLTHKSRSLCPNIAEEDHIQFFVGTCSLREDNEVHLIEVVKGDTLQDEVKTVGKYSHKDEIWHLSPCPTNSKRFFTCHSFEDQVERSVATFWEITPSATIKPLLKFHSIPGTRQVLWDPSRISDTQVITVHDGSLNVWDLEEGVSWESVELKSSDFGLKKATGGCWNPHFTEEVVTRNNKAIRFWDLRTMKETMSTDSAHSQSVRDIDFNNNKPYHFVTGGDDRQIKFWDSRKLRDPIKQIQGHAHWVYNIKYHSNLDQLVISSGTDGLVKLWNMNSISSNTSSLPQRPTDPKADSVKADSGLVKVYAEHEESVYGLAWASATDVDTWTFASLSYDGRVVIHQVPQEEKYKILLCDAGDGEDMLSDDSDDY